MFESAAMDHKRTTNTTDFYRTPPTASEIAAGQVDCGRPSATTDDHGPVVRRFRVRAPGDPLDQGKRGKHRAPKRRGAINGPLSAALAVAAIVATVWLMAGVADGDDFMESTSASNPIATSGCVIRYDTKETWGNTKPRIHANATHTCVGVKRVYADYSTGYTVVELETAGPVVSLVVDEDETLVKKGISCGGSGGMGTVKIACYDRNGDQVKAHSAAMYHPLANIWFSLSAWDTSAS